MEKNIPLITLSDDDHDDEVDVTAVKTVLSRPSTSYGSVTSQNYSTQQNKHILLSDRASAAYAMLKDLQKSAPDKSCYQNVVCHETDTYKFVVQADGAVARVDKRKYLKGTVYITPQQSTSSFANTVEDDPECCIICLDTINASSDTCNEESRRKFKCRHVFHLKCIRRWLSINTDCPVCRTYPTMEDICSLLSSQFN